MSYHGLPLRAATSLAIAAASTTGVLLAAPGAGKAYRIMALWTNVNRQATGLNDNSFFDGAVATANSIFRVGALSTTNTGSGDLEFPAPGYRMGTNNALNIENFGTAAAGTAFFGVLYYIDTV